jgi:hypothetical protein
MEGRGRGEEERACEEVAICHGTKQLCGIESFDLLISCETLDLAPGSLLSCCFTEKG